MTIALERPKPSKSAQIRAQLGYPVIDTDVHTGEFLPLFFDYLEETGGAGMVDRFIQDLQGSSRSRWYDQTWEERRAYRTARPPWWCRPTQDTLALATITIPELLYERLAEAGTDFAVLYPNLTILAPTIGREDLRRAVCRAVNIYHADIFRDYRDRLTPVAAIPMHTPQEAIEELEYAVNALGLKTLQIAGNVRRPIAAIAEKYPEAAREAYWIDTFGIDSEYDYDPFWAKCVELKVSPTLHTVGMGWTTRRSISNYQYNHIGHFASASEAFCKSLFFGGVTRRFPTLKFGFLEGGVSWGASLFADLVWHWEKRNIQSVDKYNPAHVDCQLLQDLYSRYGRKLVGDRQAQVASGLGIAAITDRRMTTAEDDFAALEIERIEQIGDRFIPNFYFGVEADDPTVTWAFNTKVNPFGARLNAFLGSDSGHWDVPDITAVTANAYSLLERGLVSETDLRDFLFVHPGKFYASHNPDFFKGTAIETKIAEIGILQ